MSTLPPCSPYSQFFGQMGITLATTLSNVGAAYGTSKAGASISTIGVMRPDLVMRSIIPIVMAGVLGIYGLIIAILLNQNMGEHSEYSAHAGYTHFAAGLIVGFSCLAAGYTIGVVGDAGVRAHALQPKLFVAMILILIFAEAIGLYGIIVGIVVGMSRTEGLCKPWQT
eukprot:Lankesteria_metandrocarpae@DN896_c0_g1_i1.p1